MGKIVKSVLPIVADIAATATGNPELIPLIHGGATLAGGGSLGDALKSGGLAFAGQEGLGALGAAFPETAASVGLSGSGNSLSDLLGITKGAGSFGGPGTIGGDIGGLFNGGSSAGGGLGSLLSGGSSSSTPTGFGTGGVAGDFRSGLAGGGNPTALNSTLTAPGFTPTPNLIAGGGSSAYGGPSGINLGASLLGGVNSLYANNQAQKDLVDAEKKSQALFSPYIASGNAANSQLSQLLGTGGDSTAANYGSLTKPFSPTDLQNDPGYQFQLQQGDQALNRKAAASGNLFSGSALKAAQDYGQGLAGTTYNNAFQRNLAQNQNIYGELAGQSGQGFNAANAGATGFENIGSAKANAGISSANLVNQSLSGLLSGSGAKKPVNINGQVYYV